MTDAVPEEQEEETAKEEGDEMKAVESEFLGGGFWRWRHIHKQDDKGDV